MRVKYYPNKSKILPDTEVVALAHKVLAHFGCKLLSEERLLSVFRQTIPLPIMLNNGIVQIWIDKYYIAYSFLDEEDVRYVYITERHIREEEDAYAKNKRGRKLHHSIRNEFNKAKMQMGKNKKEYAIFLKRIVKDSKG